MQAQSNLCDWDNITKDNPLDIPIKIQVNYIDSSPDGQYLAITQIYDIMIYNVKSNRQVGSNLIGHSGYIYQAKYSSNGLFIASASQDKSIRIWNSKNQQQIEYLNNLEQAMCVAWSPCGQHIASGCQMGDIKLWCLDRKSVIVINSRRVQELIELQYLKNSRYVISTYQDQMIRIWDTYRGQQLFYKIVTSDTFLITAYSNNIVLWNYKRSKRIAKLVLNEQIDTFSISQDQRLLVLWSWGKPISIWNIWACKKIADIDPGFINQIKDILFSQDNRFIIFYSINDRIRIIKHQIDLNIIKQ